MLDSRCTPSLLFFLMSNTEASLTQVYCPSLILKFLHPPCTRVRERERERERDKERERDFGYISDVHWHSKFMLQTGSHSAKNQLVWRKHGVKGNMGCMRLMYRRKHILFLLLCATTVWLIYHIFTFTSGNCIVFFDNVYMLTRISSIFSWLCWRFSVEQCLCGRWYRSICQFYAEISFFCDSLLSEL